MTVTGSQLLARLTPLVEAHEAEQAHDLSAEDKAKLLELLATLARV